MYIYKLSEGDYEYQSDRLLSHNDEYSEEEFKAIIIGAIKYNRKHNKDDPNYVCEINSIVETLIKIYDFEIYKLPIQAWVWDGWSLERLVNNR